MNSPKISAAEKAVVLGETNKMKTKLNVGDIVKTEFGEYGKVEQIDRGERAEVATLRLANRKTLRVPRISDIEIVYPANT